MLTPRDKAVGIPGSAFNVIGHQTAGDCSNGWRSLLAGLMQCLGDLRPGQVQSVYQPLMQFGAIVEHLSGGIQHRLGFERFGNMQRDLID
jgi:hypothetical protein